ncbi:MAG: ParB/RepB/Spo0J family partition protein [Holosporaceae bacterium]|jgi:ParB family chromosome partitioning protein|nr:ParB/RepB/Spo0J family partition protein [Holosporaceae bacterium]
MSEKILGRGLSAFLNMNEVSKNYENGKSIINLTVSCISRNPYQPRQIFDEENLVALSESIRRNGVLQPILVAKIGDGNYQLVAGERRLRASKMAGLDEIPAIVMEISEKDQLEIAILENIQREDLNPMDEAEAYRRLIDEFHHTQEQLSDLLGKSRSHVANILRLLSLPGEVKKLLRARKITFGHARALIGLPNAEEIAHQIIERDINVRDVENIIKLTKNGTKSSTGLRQPAKIPKTQASVDPEVLNIANQISSLVGLDVNVRLKNNGGIIEIAFDNFEELDFLIKNLGSGLARCRVL